MKEKSEIINNIDRINGIIINKNTKIIITNDNENFEEYFKNLDSIELNNYSGLYLWVSLRDQSIKNNLDYLQVIEKFKTVLINREKNNNNNNDDSSSNKNIKTLLSLYNSSIVSNTFLQKDIKPIQKFYLSNYQITPNDCSITTTTNSTTRAKTIPPTPTQLIKVYSQYKKESMVLRDTFADKSIFKREEITKDEMTHPFIKFKDYIIDLDRNQDKAIEEELGVNPIGDWSINNSLELFKDCFNTFTKGVLNGIEWSNENHSSINNNNNNNTTKVIVSGGSVSSCLSTLPKRLLKLYYEMKMVARLLNQLKLPFNIVQSIYEYSKPYSQFFIELEKHYHSMESPFLNSDLDLFFITPSINEGKKKLEEVALKIQSNLISKSDHTDLRFVRTQNSITIVSSYPYRPIQLMIFFIRSIEDLISFYDLDCVATAYNGENVFLLPRTINAFNKRLNMVPPALFNPDNDRLYKYLYRGFNTMCFENCIHETRCDKKSTLHTLILQPKAISKNAHGRPEFIVSSYNQDSASIFNFPYGPDKSFEDVLEELTENQYENSITFKQEIFNTKNSDHKVHPCDWRFKFIKIKNLSSKVSFKCYMCKEKNLEDSTSRLCSYCSYLNGSLVDDLTYEISRAPLVINEKYAIVTGGRIKIGLKIAINLLKLGFNVIITTRFPQCAMEKFKELLKPKHLERLRIYGVDFRNVQTVQSFIDTIKSTIPRVDILINNAAQTIRRPRAYFYDLIQKEKQLLQNNINNNNNASISPDESKQHQQQNGVLALTCKKDGGGLSTISSIEIVEKVLIDSDKDESNFELFPPGKVDEHGEQLDLREKTSWVQSVEEISVVEVAEVSLVNSTIPFMLISQLSPMMGSNCSPNNINKNETGYEKSLKLIKRNDWSYIVNVTSPEGEFKNEINSLTGLHVHTNMAKSSLNMLTKTIAYAHELKNIYVCGADTGWVSDMQPKRNDIGLPSRDPPLSEEDGANRVLYPIFHHMVKDNRHPSGINFVHFKPVEW
ncbi:hypothetical protein ACTFIV_000151 [Dictyostelium citrinum]